MCFCACCTDCGAGQCHQRGGRGCSLTIRPCMMPIPVHIQCDSCRHSRTHLRRRRKLNPRKSSVSPGWTGDDRARTNGNAEPEPTSSRVRSVQTDPVDLRDLEPPESGVVDAVMHSLGRMAGSCLWSLQGKSWPTTCFAAVIVGEGERAASPTSRASEVSADTNPSSGNHLTGKVGYRSESHTVASII